MTTRLQQSFDLWSGTNVEVDVGLWGTAVVGDGDLNTDGYIGDHLVVSSVQLRIVRIVRKEASVVVAVVLLVVDDLRGGLRRRVRFGRVSGSG